MASGLTAVQRREVDATIRAAFEECALTVIEHVCRPYAAGRVKISASQAERQPTRGGGISKP